MNKVLLTGVTGFVGGYIYEKLSEEFSVDVLVRNKVDNFPTNSFINDISEKSDLTAALKDKDIVIHCAARAHVMKDKSADPTSLYLSNNTLATKHLAEQAGKMGVKKFIFLSTIKVNGELTENRNKFKYDDTPAPTDLYAKSKLEAEICLKEISDIYDMQIIIIRPPLVYGPGVKANFASIINYVSRGLPSFFSMVKQNKRSLIYVKNLSDFVYHVAVINTLQKFNIFLVSDGHDLSTHELFQHLSKSSGRKIINIPIPVFVWKLIGRILGKKQLVSRLVDSLQVDISHTTEITKWVPPYSVSEGMVETCSNFYNKEKS